jgi:hypothetical protein
VEFFVISFFHETKIPTVDMKVQVYSKFSKNKIWKNKNLHAPWRREQFILPSVGARFKRLERKISKGFSQDSLFPVPILLLKTSNTHNFWSVGPKNSIFLFPRSLLRDASSQKVSKNLKIMWAHVTLTKIGLSAVRTFGP